MIIKLIETKEKPATADGDVRNLAAYMTDPDPRRLQPDAVGLDYGLTLAAYMTTTPAQPEKPRERVLYRGAMIGGMAQDWDAGAAEMERRLERRSRKVKKPGRHVVASFRAGENPDEKDCAEVIAVLARELDCEAAVALWAAHADTDNVHIHILFITVDPQTGEALPFGQGAGGRSAYKEAMQRAIARIEHSQQLQAEAGARYEVVDGHVLRLSGQPALKRRREPLREKILAFEEETGFAAFTRTAQEIAGPILDVATSWDQLHRDLALRGLGIRRADKGGEIYADGERVKLSNVDRKHSWPKLTGIDRLGPYEAPVDLNIQPYTPRIMDDVKAARWLKLQEDRRNAAGRIDDRIAMLLAARDASIAETQEQIASYQADLSGFDGDPRLRRDMAQAWTRLRTSVALSIRQSFGARIDALRALRRAALNSSELASIDMEALGAPDMAFTGARFGSDVPSIASIAGYEGERAGQVVRYWSGDDRKRNSLPALVDTGVIIWVNDTSDRAVEAALLLAKDRFGQVSVFGDEAFIAQCHAAAERLGMKISVTTVRAARRRARRADAARRLSRQAALDSWRREKARQMQSWARAYKRATPLEDHGEQVGHVSRLAHHAAARSERFLNAEQLIEGQRFVEHELVRSVSKSLNSPPRDSSEGLS